MKFETRVAPNVDVPGLQQGEPELLGGGQQAAGWGRNVLRPIFIAIIL